MTTRGIRAGVAIMAVLALALGACGGDGDVTEPSAAATDATGQPGEPAPEPTQAEPTGNGSLFVFETAEIDGMDPWRDWTKSIIRYTIDESGAVSSPTELASGTASDTDGPGVVAGLGDTILVGQFSGYWTKTIDVYDISTGDVTSTVDAPRWCGGEGLTYGPCVLVSADRLVRTSELGDPAQQDKVVMLSSLVDGTDVATWGPFPHLYGVFATSDPNTVLLRVGTGVESEPPQLLLLDLSTGETRFVGAPDGWMYICPIGNDSLLGFATGQELNEPTPAVVFGDEPIADISWDSDRRVAGCSADGRFLYLTQGGGQQPVVVERVTLADGTTDTVLTLEVGTSFSQITR